MISVVWLVISCFSVCCMVCLFCVFRVLVVLLSSRIGVFLSRVCVMVMCCCCLLDRCVLCFFSLFI